MKKLRHFAACITAAAITLCTLTMPVSAHEHHDTDTQEDYVSVQPTGDAAEHTQPSQKSLGAPEKNAEFKAYGSDSLIPMSYGVYNHYYLQLNPEEKDIYCALYDILRYPDQVQKSATFYLKTKPGSEAYKQLYWNASDALCYDHPEFFWFYQQLSFEGTCRYADDVPNANGEYAIQLEIQSPYTRYKEEMTAFNKSVANFMSGIDFSKSQANIVLQIHDKLINICRYNTPVYEASPKTDYAHTAYGALVSDSSGHNNYAVCDGYSFAFQYLCQQAGIDCLTVHGFAGDDTSSMGNHAWNMVNIDGSWYELDATWNDIDPEDSWYQWNAGAAMADDSDAMYDARHYLFMVPTDYINNFNDTEYFSYYLYDGSWFYPRGASVHRRYSSNDSWLFSQLPTATATDRMHGNSCH